MTGKKWLLAVLGLLLSAGAQADIVHLANGKSLEGKVTETEDKVVVALAQGTMSFPRAQVLRIERKESVLDVFAAKRAALPAGDAAARVALAAWAHRERMERQAQELLREALELDPNQPEARKELGFVEHDGKWVTPEEKMQAMGLVRFEEQWMTPEAVAQVKRARAEADLALEDRKRAEAELAIKAAEVERLRADRDRLDAERQLLEAERAKVEAERRRLDELVRSYPPFRCAAGHTWYHPECPFCTRVPIVIIRTTESKDPKGPKDPKDPVVKSPAQ